MTDQNQDQLQEQTQVQEPIDVWNDKFRALMQEAQTEQLFAPNVLLILQRAATEIQNQINFFIFNHSHPSEKE